MGQQRERGPDGRFLTGETSPATTGAPHSAVADAEADPYAGWTPQQRALMEAMQRTVEQSQAAVQQLQQEVSAYRIADQERRREQEVKEKLVELKQMTRPRKFKCDRYPFLNVAIGSSDPTRKLGDVFARFHNKRLDVDDPEQVPEGYAEPAIDRLLTPTLQQWVYPDDGWFECGLCPQRFPSEAAYRVHLNEHGSAEVEEALARLSSGVRVVRGARTTQNSQPD